MRIQLVAMSDSIHTARWVSQICDQGWDLHLKGAGMTPFSRDGDGWAVLRSTIREYLCCAAMQGLGIPTTPALCLVGSDDKVYREQVETGAVDAGPYGALPRPLRDVRSLLIPNAVRAPENAGRLCDRPTLSPSPRCRRTVLAVLQRSR